MNIKIDLSVWKNKNTYLDILKKISAFWTAKIVWIFLIALAIAAAYLVYLWYFFIFHPSWSEEKKQAYLNSNGREVILNESLYQSLVENFSQRREAYLKTPEKVNDIFRLP